MGEGVARAQSMNPTPERLVLQPAGLPAGQTCQTITANPSLVGGAANATRFACLPDNAAFKNLVSELGFALAPSVVHPARTVGFGGFLISLEAAYTHINADGATHPSSGQPVQYWHQGTQGATDNNGNYQSTNASPDSLLGVYSLNVRKGLPFGFELGGALGYVQDTSLWTVGADVRWAILEGFRTGPLGYLPDLAVGGGVRTVTGSSKMYLTTVGIDVELSKPIPLASAASLTPYIGFQHLIVFGNSAVLDASPNVNAIQQCGYEGVQPNGSSGTPGAPACKNNNSDFNNNITFASVQVNHERIFTGLTYRFELLYLAAQFLMEQPFVPLGNIDSDLNSTLQWTLSLQAGVFF